MEESNGPEVFRALWGLAGLTQQAERGHRPRARHGAAHVPHPSIESRMNGLSNAAGRKRPEWGGSKPGRDSLTRGELQKSRGELITGKRHVKKAGRPRFWGT